MNTAECLTNDEEGPAVNGSPLQKTQPTANSTLCPAPKQRLTLAPDPEDIRREPDNDEVVGHRRTVEAAILRAQAGDPGAAYERPLLEALRALKVASPPDFVRLRSRLKDSHKDVRMGLLDGYLREGGNEGSGPESVADELVNMVRDVAELFHGEDRVAYASFLEDGHRETWPLDSTGFREWLGARYYRDAGRAPTEAAVTSALNTLAGIGKFDGPEVKVWLRVAKHDGHYFLDLCNDAWQAVEISADGWQVLDHPPVRFRRTPTMRPLPVPATAGDLPRLWEFVNVVTEDRPLFLAALLEMLRPDTDFIVMEFIGEQGSGKSDTQERVRDLIDPSVVGLRAAPKERGDVFIAAANNWVVSFNNLSRLSAEQQDAVCTLSTGGGFAGRTLYTNTEETVVETKRPVLINGISTLATAQDLVDRTLRFDLPEIGEEARRPKSEMLAAFEAARPVILGGLLDLFADTLRELPRVKLDKRPRMADFAAFGEAMFKAIGRTDSFVALYRERRDFASRAALEDSPVTRAVLAYVGSPTGTCGWDGPAGGLLEALTPFRNDGDRWPKSPPGVLRRAPTLRACLAQCGGIGQVRGTQARRDPRDGEGDSKGRYLLPWGGSRGAGEPSRPSRPSRQRRYGGGP